LLTGSWSDNINAKSFPSVSSALAENAVMSKLVTFEVELFVDDADEIGVVASNSPARTLIAAPFHLQVASAAVTVTVSELAEAPSAINHPKAKTSKSTPMPPAGPIEPSTKVTVSLLGPAPNEPLWVSLLSCHIPIKRMIRSPSAYAGTVIANVP